jgi:putative FmdB family regulatory protein
MPIYEYECRGCGHQFEEWQKMSDSPVRKCPSCGKRKVDRLVSLSAFHLKGSGWYVTDYGGKNSGNKPASEGSSDSESGEKESKSKDKESKSKDKPKTKAKAKAKAAKKG